MWFVVEKVLTEWKIVLFQDDNGIEFFNTIVLQPHLKLVTDLGRGYHVRCRYKSREAAAAAKNVNSSDSSEMIRTDDDADALKNSTDRREHGRSLGAHTTTNDIPMPGCHMKIYSGSNIAESVKIGDPLKLKIYIDKQNVYGMHILDCNVRDGLGWGEQNLVQLGYACFVFTFIHLFICLFIETIEWINRIDLHNCQIRCIE